MADCNIAISGMSVAGTLAPGLPVLRTLQSEPAFAQTVSQVVGISYDPLDPPSYDPSLCQHTYLFPYPMHGPERLLKRLQEVHKQVPLSAIIPTLDSEIGNYLKIAPQLKQLGIGVILPSQEAFALRGKQELPQVAEATGLRIPHSTAASSLTEALQQAQDFSFPFVIKGNLHGATVIYGGSQIVPAVEEHARKWGYPVILQEYIAGTEYDVVALGDADGELLGAVPMKKLQLDDRGKAWGAVTVDDPELIELARDAVAGLKWHGPLELELMREQGSDQPYLIEINPRFPAWIHLAGAAGQNLPWTLLQMALGQAVTPYRSYKSGVLQLRRCVDMTCDLGAYEALVTAGEVHLNQLSAQRVKPQEVSIYEAQQRPFVPPEQRLRPADLGGADSDADTEEGER
ncbi:MAG: ATP-grasp domain-containing protein [Deltaproteobacteria bacterium]|nr:ATP-grasp domain-containing protein [Deltaproteobacteria bacterium]